MRVNKARAVTQQDAHINDKKHRCFCRMAMNYRKFTDSEWAQLIALIKEGDFREFKKEFRKWEAQHGSTSC